MTSAVRRLLPYLARYRRSFLVGFGCVLVTTSIQLLSPWILKYAIDDLHSGVTREKLLFYAGLMLLVACIGGLFRFAMRRVIIGVSRHVEYDLRNDVFAHLQRLPVSYFQSHRTGDLMSRATNDLSAVRMMIGPAVMYTATTGIVFVVALILMVSIDGRLTVAALVPLPFVSIAVNYFGNAIHRRFERIQAQLADLSAVVQEALSGVRVIRAYAQEPAEVERFRRTNRDYLDRNRALIVLQGIYNPILSLLLGIGSLLVLWLGSREVIRGRITLGELVAFNAYVVMLSWPMIAFGWVTNLLQRGTASWKRLLEILDAPPKVPGTHEAQEGARHLKVPGTDPLGGGRTTISGSIECRDLTFEYVSGRPVLAHVTARIEAGQTAAIVGSTGSGKSTLVSLIARLHDPPPGTVFVDGVDVLDWPLADLRGAIGFVPQEPFLFSDTIAENVAFGRQTPRPSASPDKAAAPADAAVVAAASIARLDKDVADFPRGYETLVGERGITLSGGQKQRTALARAIYIDPRILVLDDALSAVDTYTEEEILQRLRGVMKERTSIIVSHRISTVRDADIIFVLDDAGRLAERGRHDDLIRRGGLYADLYRQQLLEEELAAS
jgi:ATP-binding cassette, subfamily B, multidrug efflux pump